MSDSNLRTVATVTGAALLGAATHYLVDKQYFQKEAKTVPSPHHKLYIYDHCPFCVKARMIFGLKNVPVTLVFLANHDEVTPISLVGSKQVPILEAKDGAVMPESMDIVRYIDQNEGEKPILAPSANREDLKKWIEESAKVFRHLYHPRFHACTLFGEFAQKEARDYYKKKKEKSIGPFEENLKKTPELVEKANAFLLELEKLMKSELYVNGELSYDDIDLFGRLRGITLVKDLKWPPKLRSYLHYYSSAGDIPLLHDYAKY